ncbi:MAG: thymidylate kinase [Thaumarchaeota archaeon]|nr:thymidylate kinase [Candidatus Calditenuaceae archaeon]MDW8186510.1 dTMP kinase [Nitrososphaerota archaeon]
MIDLGDKKCVVTVFEGTDGSGKTSLLRLTAQMLRAREKVVVTYKTPSRTKTGAFAVGYGNRRGISPLTRMLLFLANTVEDSQVMKGAVRRAGADYLLIDRYYLCSVVFGLAYIKYRGVSSDVTASRLIEVVEELGRGTLLNTDVYVIVDVEERERLARVSRGRKKGFLEDVTIFQELVREGYREFATSSRAEVIWVINEPNSLRDNAERLAAFLLSLSSSQD